MQTNRPRVTKASGTRQTAFAIFAGGKNANELTGGSPKQALEGRLHSLFLPEAKIETNRPRVTAAFNRSGHFPVNSRSSSSVAL